ncbi:MAG: putative Iron dicitrate transrane sensor FecR [Nitrospira sp.]|jgi:transmembrane sensor|nr:putative Iron dicitrate transrane sensor FecR [Nitrospira sp.]
MRLEDDRSQPPSGNPLPEGQLIKEATAWFMRQAADDFSSVEQRRLEAWCAQSPAHARAYHNVHALWNAPEMHRATAQSVAGGVVHEVREQARHPWRFAGTAAAVLLLIVSLALWNDGLLIWLKADYSTGTGEQRVVTLPDQSVVTLNTDTSIAVRYASDRRYIELLRGEASFAVQPNPARPFTVESQGVATTAIGTQFLVRNRSADVQVTVLSGSVRVADGRKGPDEALRLSAGDQVSVGPHGAGSIDRVDTASIAAWMQGRLVFVRTPLADVVHDLARYHRGYIFIWNPGLRTLPVTGIYNLSDPSHIFTALADTLPIRMVRLTDHLIVIR